MAESKPSSIWRKQLPSKKRKLDANPDHTPAAKKPRKTPASAEPSTSCSEPSGLQGKAKLKQMVLGQLEYSRTRKEPGKYLALDCEMVGVGIDGSESSLARVSLVNYHGAVLLDEFVRQRERVVDYRTKWSGVRPKDLVNAQSFDVIQRQVANLLKDKVVVGHALYNDFKALLLSHPRLMTRDTQFYAHKFGVSKSGRIALRDLVKQELGLTIQSGEHSSVTDARATMAVYRIHQKAWEKGIPRHSTSSKKAKELEVDTGSSSRGNSKKGLNAGLSTIITRKGGKYIPKDRRKNEGETKSKAKANETSEWWTLPATKISWP